MRRVAVAATALVLAAIASFAAPVEDARACSCVRPDAERDLARADAAFVGTLVSSRVRGNDGYSTFDVESVAKGELEPTVVVRSAASGASCGLELEEGTRTGLLLSREGGEWTSTLCVQIAAEELLAAGAPRPPAAAGRGRDWTWKAGALAAAAALAVAVGLWIRRTG